MSNIYLIENNRSFHQLFQRILELNGHKVVGCADNYPECIKDINRLEKLPDFIIINQQEAVDNYKEVVEQLLKMNPEFRIILMSSNGLAKKAKFENGAAVLVVKKPFSIKGLHSSIDLLNNPTIS